MTELGDHIYDVPDPAKRPRCATGGPGDRKRRERVVRCLQAAGRDHEALDFISRSYGTVGREAAKILREYVEEI